MGLQKSESLASQRGGQRNSGGGHRNSGGFKVLRPSMGQEDSPTLTLKRS